MSVFSKKKMWEGSMSISTWEQKFGKQKKRMVTTQAETFPKRKMRRLLAKGPAVRLIFPASLLNIWEGSRKMTSQGPIVAINWTEIQPTSLPNHCNSQYNF